MRTARILALIASAMILGSAQASSLNVPRERLQVCSPAQASAISLVGSQGAFGVVVFSSRECGQ
jgi:uncharacterized protein YigA (DUF484 family)